MIASTLWTALLERWRPAGRAPQFITLQHVLPGDADLVAVQAALDRVGQALAVQFELKESSGDIMLMDADLASRMSTEAVQAFAAARPLVTMSNQRSHDDKLLSAAQRLERCQRELLVQLREISLVRRRAAPGAAGTGPTVSQGGHTQAFDSGFDSRLDGMELLGAELAPAQRQLVQRVLSGMRTPSTPALTASYGPGAHLRFDFSAGLVSIDALALQHLRVRRELPQATSGATSGATPGPDAQLRELVETVWDLGLACGPFALQDEPCDWWRTPLQWTRRARIEALTRVPRHIEMARCLQAAPLSPSELRRRAQVGVTDLRCFVQAALMSGLLRWQPDGSGDQRA